MHEHQAWLCAWGFGFTDHRGTMCGLATGLGAGEEGFEDHVRAGFLSISLSGVKGWLAVRSLCKW